VRRALQILGVVVLLTVLFFAGRNALEYLRWNGPGLLSRIVDPIAENQEVTWAAGPATASTSPDQRPPNVILILVDDLGYNDLTFAGGGVANGAVPTPNIDSIAREGIELTAGYAGNATCAPSRAAILTGRYPTRFGFEFTPAPAIFMRMVADWSSERLHPTIYYEERENDLPPYEEEILPVEEITIAELLRERGYHTVALGKWHLG
jgi:arylsulfatase A-like enzyme